METPPSSPIRLSRSGHAACGSQASSASRIALYRPFLDDAEYAHLQANYGKRASEWPALIAAVRAHPLMDAWYQGAMAEPAAWLLPKYENPA